MSVIYPSPLFGAQSPHSTNLYDNVVPNVGGGVFVNTPIYHTATFDGLVSEPELTPPGTLLNAVNWTFYNRIVIEPAQLDLGNILSEQIRHVIVWNGFTVNKSLQDFDAAVDEGITVVEPVSPVYAIRPLQVLDYELHVTTTGPSSINSTLTWTIAGVEYTAVITGNRSVVFPFPPNYSDDVVESLEWRSNILRSFDGSEQRRALRTKARRSFGYKFSLFGKDPQWLQNILWGWQNRVFAFPIWTDKRLTTQAQSIGDETLYVDPVNYSFTVDSPVIIYGGVENYEVVEVLTVGANLTLKRGIIKNWPVGTSVYPMLQGHMPSSLAVKRLTNTVIEGQAYFDTSPDITDPFTPAISPTIIYDSLEVVTVQPNWISGLDNTFDFGFDTLDFQTGSVEWKETEIYSRNTRRYSWLLTDRASIKNFRAFLERRRGQVKTCWIPSWTDDFTLAHNIALADSVIYVQENGFRGLIGVNPAHDRIAIRTLSGLTYYRRITDVGLALDGVTVALTIDSPLGVDYTIAQIKAMNMLHLCRLATDKIDLLWKSNQTMVIETTFMTVPS